MPYAEKTEVSLDRSKQEIERTLQRYGADRFAYGWDQESAVVAFRMRGRHIRYKLPLPALKDFSLTPSQRWTRTEAVQRQAWEQACRQRWRALALIVKAKLEAVEQGIASFEDEFLAQTLLPDGTTVGDWAKPQIAVVYEQGKMPPLLVAGKGQ